ncbi:hypothetical protein GCM10011342_29480 [Aquisalinus flavus]|uniref:DedA family protein n=1 Tax=Aquisalinus flavus TaxID=1526572 RepID=A0A8J2V7F5_9PROT|nr:DedA family protein [Aquisalinus flavus]MBD0428072.1 DedA family protein [Aquisalinus flavus]GGD18869.1 hypothetical protein GCM10011342_29480 [Aquisalinus flavus]
MANPDQDTTPNRSSDTAAGAGSEEEKPHKSGMFGALRGRLGLTGGFFVYSIFESTIFPVPIEAPMVPAMIARRDAIWAICTAVLAGCIVGTIAAYLVGAYLFEPIAQPLIDVFGAQQGFDDARQQFEENGMATIIIIALSPIPLVLASLGAGVVGINPFLAIGFIAVTRAIRYYGMGLIAWYAAPSLRKLWGRLENPWIKRTLILVSVLALAALFML